MYRILFALVELAAAGVFLLPLFLLYGKFTAHSRMQIFCSILFGFYFAAVLALVGFPSILDHSPDVTLHLVPLAGIPADFQNACLNVLLFVPLGYFSLCSGIPANPSAARSCLPSASHFSLSFRSFSPCAQPISTISSRTLQARQSDTSWQSMPQKSFLPQPPPMERNPSCSAPSQPRCSFSPSRLFPPSSGNSCCSAHTAFQYLYNCFV